MKQKIYNSAEVINDKDFMQAKQQRPVKCVYIIDGLYIGSTNDLKRRIREYLGRAERNDPVRSNTPIMRYIKDRLSSGNTIRFFILHDEPCREFIFINRYTKRGIKLMNVVLNWNYEKAKGAGKAGFYERFKETKRPVRRLVA